MCFFRERERESSCVGPRSRAFQKEVSLGWGDRVEGCKDVFELAAELLLLVPRQLAGLPVRLVRLAERVREDLAAEVERHSGRARPRSDVDEASLRAARAVEDVDDDELRVGRLGREGRVAGRGHEREVVPLRGLAEAIGDRGGVPGGLRSDRSLWSLCVCDNDDDDDDDDERGKRRARRRRRETPRREARCRANRKKEKGKRVFDVSCRLGRFAGGSGTTWRCAW